jgi:hypothetical protein
VGARRGPNHTGGGLRFTAADRVLSHDMGTRAGARSRPRHPCGEVSRPFLETVCRSSSFL